MPIKLNGSTSGSVELNVPAAVGSDLQLTLPATAGEVIVKGSDGSVDLGAVEIDSSGRLLVGTSNTVTGSSSQRSYLQILGGTAGNQQGTMNLCRNANSTDISLNQLIGEIYFCDKQAGEYAKIKVNCDGANAGSDDYPGRMEFHTTADGASSPTERMRIDSGGNVGIGTLPNDVDSIGRALNIASSTGGAIYLQDTDSLTGKFAAISYNGSTTGLQIHAHHPSSFIDFGTNGSERFRADSSGRLLVGTSTSETINGDNLKLQIKDTGANAGLSIHRSQDTNAPPSINLALSRAGAVVSNNDPLGVINFFGHDGTDLNSSAAQIACLVDGTPGSNDMPGRLTFATTSDGASSPTERMRIQSNGAFTNCTGIYDDTTGAAANIHVNSSGSLMRSTSSAKYKKDVETLQDSYADALLNCRPVWYRSTSTNDNPAHGWWGFIAEEVAEIDPRLVQWKTTEPVFQADGSVEHTPCDPEPDGVQYDRFVPHLLNLIKRQQAAIETLETKVASLEASS